MLWRIINIQALLRYARNWVLIALIPALIVGALVYLGTRQEAKIYDASASVYVQQSSSPGSSLSIVPDVFASAQAAQTYSQLIVQPIIARAADRLLAGKYPGYQVEAHALRSAGASVQPSQQAQQSPLITITVTDTIPGRAADAANAVTTVFIAQITRMNDQRFAADIKSLRSQQDKNNAQINKLTQSVAGYRGPSSGLDALKVRLGAYQGINQTLLSSVEQLKLTRDASSSSVTTFSPATAPTLPTGPHPLRNALLWTFVVLLLGSAGLYGYEYLLDLPRTPEEVEQLAKAPILGAVQAFRASGLVTTERPHSAAAEAYRLIRTNVRYTNVDRPPRAVVVTSPLAHDGKSTTSGNLAQVFAEGGTSVILVDADLRRPSLQEFFGEKILATGLTHMLVSNETAGYEGSATEQANLSVLGAGPVPPNPADLLSSERMKEILNGLRKTAGFVVIDTPPVLAVPDATILSTMVDGVILVIDSSRTRRKDIRHAQQVIEKVGGRILGVVVNRVKARGPLYSHYASYYTSKYTSSKRKNVKSKRRAEEGVA